ncbi:hypothetical protein [Stenotrophomonas acidaminiphila]|uniref:hypothetical protein n=1 Tax=Stenotrophomonas acidaminiphila TaxID=128780 RepID=UPI0020C69A46|nr:hypothetical protein [Stenotrophomonas acidaminiphila]
MRLFALALIAALASAPALAQTTVKIGRATLPVTFLAEVTGEAGQDQDAFAQQVGSVLRDHSAATGTEACAMLCRAPSGAWGALPLTIGAHTACPVANVCPQGMTATGVGIHSHPTADTYVANEADMAVLGQDKHLRRRAGQSVRGGNPEQFSAEDFDAGEGYMASGTTLYHQAGKRAVRAVGPLDAPAAAVAAR